MLVSSSCFVTIIVCESGRPGIQKQAFGERGVAKTNFPHAHFPTRIGPHNCHTFGHICNLKRLQKHTNSMFIFLMRIKGQKYGARGLKNETRELGTPMEVRASPNAPAPGNLFI